MKLVIRSARPEDGPALTRIEQECFSNPTWNADAFFQYKCSVAECEGTIAGFIVTQQIFRGNGNQKSEHEILNLGVSPISRGIGIATALLEHVIQLGAVYVLEVRESNTAARNLYKKIGFIETGSRLNYYDNPLETAIVMVRK